MPRHQAAVSEALPTGPSPRKTDAKLWSYLGQLTSRAPTSELDKRFGFSPTQPCTGGSLSVQGQLRMKEGSILAPSHLPSNHVKKAMTQVQKLSELPQREGILSPQT